MSAGGCIELLLLPATKSSYNQFVSSSTLAFTWFLITSSIFLPTSRQRKGQWREAVNRPEKVGRMKNSAVASDCGRGCLRVPELLIKNAHFILFLFPCETGQSIFPPLHCRFSSSGLPPFSQRRRLEAYKSRLMAVGLLSFPFLPFLQMLPPRPPPLGQRSTLSTQWLPSSVPLILPP